MGYSTKKYLEKITKHLTNYNNKHRITRAFGIIIGTDIVKSANNTCDRTRRAGAVPEESEFVDSPGATALAPVARTVVAWGENCVTFGAHNARTLYLSPRLGITIAFSEYNKLLYS